MRELCGYGQADFNQRLAHEMALDLFPLFRPGLHAFEPERAHELTLRALELGVYPRPCTADAPLLRQHVFGLQFANPIGMAAGFDKDARVPDALFGLGFGFAEAGTITPRPQSGNPRPRLFRLKADRAVINRMGFNNGGLAALERRLANRRRGRGVLGINIGANKDSADKTADYVTGVKAAEALADYITVNISSPNTPGLRDLQARDALNELVGRVMEARTGRAPLLIKIAPDLDDGELEDIASVAMAHGIDGMIVSNTTLSRRGLSDPASGETGGMSGRPLFELSTRVLAKIYLLTEGKLPLIGVGGVDSGAAAYKKILAGASLIQLYSALIYEGPALIGRIKDDLARALARDGFASLAEATGTQARALVENQEGQM